MASVEMVISAHLKGVRDRLTARDLLEDAAIGLDSPLRIETAEVPDGVCVTVSFDQFKLPFFGWAMNRSILNDQKRAIRFSLSGLAQELSDERTITALAKSKRPRWASKSRLTTTQATTIATVGIAMALCGYAGSLLTQALDPIAESFKASDPTIGFLAGFARVGALFALAGAVLADKVGRRRLLLVSIAVAAAASLASAVAFDIRVFALFQVFVRGASNLAGVVGFIIVTEEAPEDARAWTLAITGILAAMGFVLGAALFPFTDLHEDAWRILFAIGGLGVLLVPLVARTLTETKRYVQVASRTTKLGHISEIASRHYGPRFLALAAVGFFLNVFFAPTSQYTNRFLADERGLGAVAITLLRAITQTIPALAGALVGGRIAESIGRKPVAIWGVAVGAVASAVFFLTDGIALALFMLVSTAAVALAGPALAVFNTELFPTEVRGTAGGTILVVGVAGSVAGLIFASQISASVGGLGIATALTCSGGLIAALLLLKLPEARGETLERISPSEV